MSISADAPLPQEWRGHWQRVALEEPDGSGDITTTVHWLQTGRAYGDIRVPAGAAVGSVNEFEDLTPAAARLMARREGFAGSFKVDGALGRWERRIDFSPAASGPDEGWLARHRRMMVETGRHRNYVEHWWSHGHADDVETLVDTDTTILVRAGPVFVFAQERRPEPVAPGSLVARVDEAAGRDDRPALRRLLDCEISFGTITTAGTGERVWRITASTLPWREGALFDAHEAEHRADDRRGPAT